MEERRITMVRLLAAILLLSSLPAAAIEPLSPEKSRAVFERFKSLQGEWRGKSTRGWTNTSSMKVIGSGSAIVSSSSFDDDRDKDMLTVFHLDGDRLLLTHYCMAGNQPRLVATAADDTSVTFEFLDATNMPHRDHGHMDKVVFRFGDRQRYSSRWTWYQDGKERWLEEIENRRSH
jgi:hypothetical protein